MVFIKIDPFYIGDVQRFLEVHLCEYENIKDDGIIRTDKSGIDLMNSLGIKYEIVGDYKVGPEDIYKLLKDKEDLDTFLK